MRLICPNCDAEYEVDAAAIPDSGRDVQCSACGHAWFQLPPDIVEAREEEEALYEPPVAPPVAPVAGGLADEDIGLVRDAPPVAPLADRDDDEDDDDGALTAKAAPIAAAAPMPGPAPARDEEEDEAPGPKLGGRSLDESLLAVLREEAERETAARRAESAGLETQTEMPLTGQAEGQMTPAAVAGTAGPATAALRKIAKLRGEAEPAPAALAPSDPAPDATRPRRDLLPEIEEINSSLRAAGERRDVDQGAVAETLDSPAPRRGGFGNGFLTIVLLVILAALIYILAPLIADKVPALAETMAAYVAAVDSLRAGLDGLARSLTDRLSGVTGGQG